EQWVTMVANGQQCQSQPNVTLVPLPADQLLVRASMDVRGRRPALAELNAVQADPSVYGTLVDQYLHSPEFITRVKELYNDALLVDREDDRDEAIDKTHAIYGEALELIA